MQKIFIAFLISFLFLFPIINSNAASGIPTILSYQGRLLNSNGDLLSGSYYFKFSIWNVATGGTSGINRLWPSSNPSSVLTTVREGVFNVNIGDTANGYPDELDYNFNTNQDIYLQIQVSSDNDEFETLSPRQRISSAVFAQITKAVSGTGQSSFGTTTPISNAIVTIEATTTFSIPALIRAAAGQLANLFSIEDSSLNHLFSINSSGGIFASSTLFVGSSDAASFLVDNSGKVGIGTTTATRKLNVLDVNSNPQLRLGRTGSIYGEFYIDASGDLRISSTGGNIRQNDENLWICSGGGCAVDTPADKGNVIIETSIIFDNKFRLQQIDASTTRMYDTTGATILEFDEGQ